MSELNVEVSNFGSKLKKVFSTDYNSDSLISLPIESLCREKKLAAKLSKELIAKQKEIVKKIKDFYMATDGFRLTWNYRHAGKK